MPISDLFQYLAPSLTSPPSGGFDVTPDDNTDLPQMIKTFMVMTAGDVAVVFKDGTEGVFPGCLVGVQYAGQLRRIKATGTTATGIKAQYG